MTNYERILLMYIIKQMRVSWGLMGTPNDRTNINEEDFYFGYFRAMEDMEELVNKFSRNKKEISEYVENLYKEKI